MFYYRFMICLTMGLVGLCIVLKTIFDSLLAEWDLWADLKYLFTGPFIHKHSYIEFTHTEQPQKFSTRLR